jgi:hypothetical protein
MFTRDQAYPVAENLSFVTDGIEPPPRSLSRSPREDVGVVAGTIVRQCRQAGCRRLGACRDREGTANSLTITNTYLATRRGSFGVRGYTPGVLSKERLTRQASPPSRPRQQATKGWTLCNRAE